MRRLFIGLLTALCLTSCAGENAPTRGNVYPLLTHAADTDGPYPDDFYTTPDSSSATGVRLDFSRAETTSTAMRALFFDAGQFRPHQAWLETLDGFSAFAPVLIPFSGPLQDISLARGIHLIDIQLGVTVPTRISHLPHAGNYWVLVRPLQVLRSAHRYTVVLTDDLRDGAGYRLQRAKGSSTGTAELAVALAAAGTTQLESIGTFSFTVQNTTGELLAIADAIAANPAPFAYDVTATDARTITGKFKAPEYRVHGVIPQTAGVPQPKGENELQFYLRLPRNHTTAPKPFPIAIWAHGLTGTRTSIPEVDDAAIIAIDAVEHGSRQTVAKKDLVAFKFFDFFHLLTTRDNLRQTEIDNISLARMVTSLDQALQTEFGMGSLIAGENIGYIGGSLGAIVGGAAAPLSPSVESMIVVVGGAGLSQAFRDGLFGLIAPNAVHFHNPLERELFFSHTQAIFDRADPVNYLRHAVHEPLPGHKSRNMLFSYVIGDLLVPNSTNQTYLWAAGLSLFGPIFQNAYGMPEIQGDTAAGNVNVGGKQRTAIAYQYNPPADEVRGLKRHGYMADNESARAQIEHFFLSSLNNDSAEVIHAE